MPFTIYSCVVVVLVVLVEVGVSVVVVVVVGGVSTSETEKVSENEKVITPLNQLTNVVHKPSSHDHIVILLFTTIYCKTGG
jgi:hypothetical protein